MEDTFQSYKPVKLHYTSCSASENHDLSSSPIILIHGFFANNSTWNRIKYNISNKARRKVYSIDLRNHGKSEYSDEFTLKHLTADVIQFMKNENIKCAMFIGHSAGGRIVMELALHKPELVEKAIVEDIAINDVNDDKINVLEMFVRQLYNTISSFPTTMSEANAYKRVNRLTARYLPQFSVNGGNSEVEKALPFYKDETTGEFKFLCNIEVLIKSISNPSGIKNDLKGHPTYTGRTLFIKGEHTIIPIDKDKPTILKHFPNAQFVTIKGGYHVSHMESTKDFVEVIINFLNSKR